MKGFAAIFSGGKSNFAGRSKHMDTRTLYNQWSGTYDEVENKTRDLEKLAAQQLLENISYTNVLELGCGTGKNTVWLSERAAHHLAVDLSEEMLARAKEKLQSSHVVFKQADITKPWDFVATQPDLITCSLILEHIEDLNFIFKEAAGIINKNGYFYICELHPYKQYTGSKARFETSEGLQVLECFVHHVADYFAAAKRSGFACVELKEWFDEQERNNGPRLISFVFQKV
jgi:ubiquinone/menaquinone biosynthesis C-methylase UbiE